jgi:IPT/TIG domain
MSVTKLTPSSGPVGTPVTVNGLGFKRATTVRFHGVKADFTVTDDRTIQTTVPAGATTGNVTVTGPLGTVRGPKFTVMS